MDKSTPSTPSLDQHLSGGGAGDGCKGKGFLVVTHIHDADPSQRIEVWAYRGPLDFAVAEPVCFGVGPDLNAALQALNHHLNDSTTRL